jgi:hypothetical protein
MRGDVERNSISLAPFNSRSIPILKKEALNQIKTDYIFICSVSPSDHDGPKGTTHRQQRIKN